MRPNVQKKVEHALTHVRRTTGSDLDAVELAYQSRTIDVKVYGFERDDYQPWVEIVIRQDGKWVEIDPTPQQVKALSEKLHAEVDKVIEETREETYEYEKPYHPYNGALNWKL